LIYKHGHPSSKTPKWVSGSELRYPVSQRGSKVDFSTQEFLEVKGNKNLGYCCSQTERLIFRALKVGLPVSSLAEHRLALVDCVDRCCLYIDIGLDLPGRLWCSLVGN
jgi:hypothetical protein